ncbi:MAG: hypothetical protein QME57_03880 [Patescibacteria group bacterium]|nr:hypothetical protein [Patescibacteria group bacterium]
MPIAEKIIPSKALKLCFLDFNSKTPRINPTIPVRGAAEKRMDSKGSTIGNLFKQVNNSTITIGSIAQNKLIIPNINEATAFFPGGTLDC